MPLLLTPYIVIDGVTKQIQVVSAIVLWCISKIALARDMGKLLPDATFFVPVLRRGDNIGRWARSICSGRQGSFPMLGNFLKPSCQILLPLSDG